jgi:hypothetical protein
MRKVQVYDLLNCGPRQAFTVIDENGEPLLVHNCWTYSPKEYPNAPDRPFILWPEYQEAASLLINEAFGKHDLLVEKSRDMGATWLCILVIQWRWKFFRRQSFLLGSRKKEYVDKSGDPKTLFWKFDYLEQNLPGWMQSNVNAIELHRHNEDNQSTVDGESTNDDFARGDRRTGIMLDEFPAVENGYSILNATRDATNCRILNGTPQGAVGAYYDTRTKLAATYPDRIIRMHWSQHPEKRRGLYTSDDMGAGRFELRVLDHDYNYPPDYKWVLDGKIRSPWYDNECERAANQQEIAQELDIDYAGSAWQWFDPKLLEKLIKQHVRRPVSRGEFAFDPKGRTPIFQENAKGRVQLWLELDEKGRVPDPKRKYAIGVDLSTGKGGEMSSNSVASVIDKLTGEKVAQFHTPHLEPWEFAVYVLAMCRFFNDAFLIWENNGPGGTFSKQVKDLGYRNVFYKEDETKFNREKTDKPGWDSGTVTKKLLLAEYSKALIGGKFLNRCEEAMKEISQYVMQPNGTIEHARAKATQDPNASGENHGDMVIADALAWRGAQDQPQDQKSAEPEAPVGSFLHRRIQSRKSKLQKSYY